MASRHLADVPTGMVVHLFDERRQQRSENLVVVRTTEPALRPKMGVGGTALGTDGVRGRLSGGRRHLSEHELQERGDVECLGSVRDQLPLAGARLAQMHLALLLVENFGEVHRGLVRAELTFHTSAPAASLTKYPSVSLVQPSSSCLILSRSRAASS